MENLPNGYFYHGYFTPNLKTYFSELIFLAADREFNKIYKRKLKFGDR